MSLIESQQQVEADNRFDKGYVGVRDFLFYLLGFSQGAIFAMTLVLTSGNCIKGIMALSGYIPGCFVKEEYNIKPINEVSIFISHGEMDQVLPYEWGRF
ncbi:alpha/beta hydrolase [Alicyclobacillus fastidiosus]|uniref:alpha/beta hydrolase n=1 Tax=Alicyclobacillus fastidiosus TaxID=392011 RepID=UPI0023E924BA|nr:hypothetical protein [Alicyclobacillus fastidiosus]GMA62940.1 hypothetical protein GCM10025859_33800 [Alicyclobacillus fastidiosus]